MTTVMTTAVPLEVSRKRPRFPPFSAPAAPEACAQVAQPAVFLSPHPVLLPLQMKGCRFRRRLFSTPLHPFLSHLPLVRPEYGPVGSQMRRSLHYPFLPSHRRAEGHRYCTRLFLLLPPLPLLLLVPPLWWSQVVPSSMIHLPHFAELRVGPLLSPPPSSPPALLLPLSDPSQFPLARGGR